MLGPDAAISSPLRLAPRLEADETLPSSPPLLAREQTAAIQKQIDETQDVMRENIQRVAERGERLDALQDKTCVPPPHSIEKIARRLAS